MYVVYEYLINFYVAFLIIYDVDNEMSLPSANLGFVNYL